MQRKVDLLATKRDVSEILDNTASIITNSVHAGLKAAGGALVSAAEKILPLSAKDLSGILSSPIEFPQVPADVPPPPHIQRLPKLTESVPVSSGTSTTDSEKMGPASTTNTKTAALTTMSTPPSYKMNTTIQDVRELFREWSVGLPGGFAVSYLEKNYGTKWRKQDPSVDRFFLR